MEKTTESKEESYPQSSGEDTELDLSGDSSGSESDLSAPPDGGYGWVVVGACMALNGFTWGVTAVSPPSLSIPRHQRPSSG